MSDHSPLLIFDSGVGGFSILRELSHYAVPLLYFADQANFPYGDKSEAWLQHRFVELAALFSHYNPRGIVLACNTGTVAAISVLRQQLSCPIFGVEPVTKMLKHHSTPVVWGTAVTTRSRSATRLRATHGTHIRYHTPTGLAQAIEAGDQPAITRILAHLAATSPAPDAIGLSCTHYPLVQDQIKHFFPNTTLYDPSQPVARHVARSLGLSLRPSTSTPLPITYYSTASVLRLKKQAKAYL